MAAQTAVIVSGTKNPDGSFTAANGVTVVAGGELYTGARFTVNGVLTPGTVDSAAKTNTLSLSTPKTYAIGVTVPGSGGTATVTVTFTVIVNDTIPPVLALPAPAPTEATSTAGAVVNYTATATDNTDGSVTVACTPPSGSTFRLGTTSVNCSAHDSAGNTSSGSFTVTVRDTTAPTLTVPANISTKATSAAGAVVTYVATATDIASGAITPVCTTASGATFPIGTTTVTCTATDPSGNSTSQTFAVTITPPYRYSGFFSPVNMGGADAFGLNLTVNSVNGGRNVPFKWEVFDDSTGLELTDPARSRDPVRPVCPAADPVLLPAGRDVAAAESQRVRRCRSHDHPDLGWYRQDHCTEVHQRAVQRGHPGADQTGTVGVELLCGLDASHR